MNKQLQQVKEFHESFGIPVLNNPTLPPDERLRLRMDILTEEVEEMRLAFFSGNIPAALDAIIDCMYILNGTALELGLQNHIDAAFDEVHSSNMSKLDENGKPIYRFDGKVLKGPNYRKPDLISILNK